MITQILRLLKKYLGFRLAASVVLSYILLMPMVALAGVNNYDDTPVNTHGRSGGSRCFDTRQAKSLNSIASLILLAPTHSN
jgi:hypothetical protein